MIMYQARYFLALGIILTVTGSGCVTTSKLAKENTSSTTESLILPDRSAIGTQGVISVQSEWNIEGVIVDDLSTCIDVTVTDVKLPHLSSVENENIVCLTPDSQRLLIQKQLKDGDKVKAKIKNIFYQYPMLSGSVNGNAELISIEKM